MGSQALGEKVPDNQELEERLIEILHRISGTDRASITATSHLMDDVGIDSLGFYEILIEADSSFGIRIQEEDLLKFRTVGDVQKHLNQLTRQQAHADPS